MTDTRNEISLCISQALEHYFADLDGEKTVGVYDMVMRAVERPMLEAVLQRCQGNQSQAAVMLGITRNTLRRKLTEYNLL